MDAVFTVVEDDEEEIAVLQAQRAATGSFLNQSARADDMKMELPQPQMGRDLKSMYVGGTR